MNWLKTKRQSANAFLSYSCAPWKAATRIVVSISLLSVTSARCEPVPGSLDVHWNEGVGAHIELNNAGRAYRFGSHYHPDEHRLELAKEDLTALPAAFESFNGFYARYPNYILTNPNRNLVALAIIAVAVLIFIVWGMYQLVCRRRQRGPTIN